MQAVRIDNALPKPLGAPDDWNAERDGHCSGLFIRPEIMGGVHFMRSAWEASPEEAGLLLAGGKLILGISGNRHPVVNMGVAQLPEDFEPVTTVRCICDMAGNTGVQVDMLFSQGGGHRVMAQCSFDGRTYAEAVASAIEKALALGRAHGWVAENWGKR